MRSCKEAAAGHQEPSLLLAELLQASKLAAAAPRPAQLAAGKSRGRRRALLRARGGRRGTLQALCSAVACSCRLLLQPAPQPSLGQHCSRGLLQPATLQEEATPASGCEGGKLAALWHEHQCFLPHDRQCWADQRQSQLPLTPCKQHLQSQRGSSELSCFFFLRARSLFG